MVHIMYKFLLFLFFSFYFAASQNLFKEYNNALDCFLNEDYICSKKNFQEFLKNRSSDFSSFDESAAYYHFLSSLKHHPDTELLFNNFMSEFALSNKKMMLFFVLNIFLKRKNV